jgi:hypothetical protein
VALLSLSRERRTVKPSLIAFSSGDSGVFMEKWKRELLRYHFHYSAQRLNIQAAFMSKHPHVPSSLHKYRSFCDQHQEALEKGVLWRSSPDRFNDPYDTVVSFDQNRFFIEDQPAQDFIRSIREMIRKVEAGEKWTPTPFQNPIRQDEWRRRVLLEFLSDQPAHIRDDFVQTTDRWFALQREQAVRLMSERMRSGYSVLSLCENATSVLMWSHYSNSHKGFCIEYDLSALSENEERRRFCYPVFYRKKLTDATRYLVKMDFHDYNNLFGTYMCLLKSDEWAYEKEWRIAFAAGSGDANGPMKMPKPKSIILGALAQPSDEAWMRTFCKDHDIRLRRASQRHNEFRLEIRDADDA